MKSTLLVKKLLGLDEMTSGLVNASFSLLEWQAVKMIFFAPCHNKLNPHIYFYGINKRTEMVEAALLFLIPFEILIINESHSFRWH